MKRKISLFLGCAALLAALLSGCGADTPGTADVELAGEAWFGRYVAIGNSLTAGLMDAGLMLDGQLGSYPSLIARQMGYRVAVSSSATFTQPYIARPGVGVTSTGVPGVVAGCLYWTGSGIDLLGTTPVAQVPALALMATLPSPYNNLGVPIATTSDVLNALTSANSQVPGNSYFDLILRNPAFGNVTMLGQAIGRKPTLVTLWIGNNDILGGATSGEPAVGVNVTPAAYFADLYDTILEQLITGVAARSGHAPLVVVANIPGIADIPYFVPRPTFNFVINGDPDAAVPAEETDYELVRFPAIGYLQGGGSLPLPDEWTLDPAEVAVVQSAVDAYNTNIASICGERGIEVVDVHAMLAALSDTGLDGLTGGHYALGSPNTAFSLDGMHPNNRGQGLLANGFIDAINAAAGTSLGHVDVSSLTWDPTYGQGTAARAAPPAGAGFVLSAGATEALDRLLR